MESDGLDWMGQPVDVAEVGAGSCGCLLWGAESQGERTGERFGQRAGTSVKVGC